MEFLSGNSEVLERLVVEMYANAPHGLDLRIVTSHRYQTPNT